MIAPLALASQPRRGEHADGATRALAVAMLSGLVGHRTDAYGAWLPRTSFRAGGADIDASRLLRALGQRRGTTRPIDVAVFVHGLFVDEQCWTVGADPLALRVERHFGWTPLFVRYNAGRHISANGDDLAALLVDLEDAWGPRLGRITLVGHSMGGLVSRSALGALERASATVLEHVERLVLLATPNSGAELERLGHVVELTLAQLARTPSRAARLLGVDALLRPGDATLFGPALRDLGDAVWHRVDATASRPLHAARSVLAMRSDGIRDVRFGYMRREEWELEAQHADRLLINHRRPLPPPPHVDTWAIAGSLWPGVGDTPSPLRTDGLVSCASAAGVGGDFDDLGAVSRGRYAELPLLAHQLVPTARRVRETLAGGLG